MMNNLPLYKQGKQRHGIKEKKKLQQNRACQVSGCTFFSSETCCETKKKPGPAFCFFFVSVNSCKSDAQMCFFTVPETQQISSNFQRSCQNKVFHSHPSPGATNTKPGSGPGPNLDQVRFQNTGCSLFWP